MLTACVAPLNMQKTHEEMLSAMSERSQTLRNQNDFKSCTFDQIKQLGDTAMINNVWGISKVRSGEMSQCIMQKKISGQQTLGWEWDVPKSARGVVAYPSVIVGQSPWVQTTSHHLPRLWEELFMIDVVYETEMQVRGKKYNLAFDLWMTHTAIPTEKDIAYEIMVWEDYHDFQSHGRRVGTVQTPFGDYWMHVGDIKRPELNLQWKYIAFVRKQKRKSGFVDLKFLLDEAVEKGYLESNLYLATIEFGNEVGNSSGMTTLKQFEVSIM